MNCSECRHWIRFIKPVMQPDVWGFCVLGCSSGGVPLEENSQTSAYAVDFDRYSARLITKEGHSCRQFEGKGAALPSARAAINSPIT